MQIGHLLLNPDDSIDFVTLVLLVCLCRFEVPLFDLIEDLLNLVEIEGPPRLQLLVVLIREVV